MQTRHGIDLFASIYSLDAGNTSRTSVVLNSVREAEMICYFNLIFLFSATSDNCWHFYKFLNSP